MSENNASMTISLRAWVAAAVLFFVAGPTALILILTTVEIGHRGPTGDMLGGALGWSISAASTILFLATLFMQRHELKLQRTELSHAMAIAREQKDIAASQDKHAEEQVQIAKLDSLRRSLGQLLEVRISIVNSFSHKSPEEAIADRHARLLRLSKVVRHHLASKTMDEAERTSWFEAFGPWHTTTFEGENVVCIKPPFGHVMRLDRKLVTDL